MLRISSVFVSSLFISGLAVVPSAAREIHFSREIRPILSENCFQCHGPDEGAREADLRLDLESAAKELRDGSAAVVPGKPEASELLRRMVSRDPDEVMPPPKSHKTVTPAQIALLTEWIRQGAPWGGHWSYQRVERPAVPVNSETHPIDAFLAERLKREKLFFAAEADSATLTRRAALDVTGLPPSLDEMQKFSHAKSYDEIVDHYLASPSFGEHWARLWLDLARYADSAGYPSDPGREIWAYRDWVIRALNDNMPFDQFTIEQIAGDLLPKPTDDQLVATAFHRNTMTQNEGGTDDEEFRIAAVVDRVNTTYAVWMGTTMACAQCHNHKYDPITINEFYRSYALFNQSADADKKDESPIHELISAEKKQQREVWKKASNALDAKFNKPSDEWLAGFDDWLESTPELKDTKLKVALNAGDKRTDAEKKSLQQYYVRNVTEASKTERKELAELTKKLADTKPVTVPVMQELPADKRRKTQIQLRGNWQTLGDEVQPGVPAAFPKLHVDASAKQPVDRLAFARWLVDRDNPLTARVTVNRLWEAVFGIGIVRSSEDFGSQGDLPTHPELLDWLAAEFMESGWDVKHVLKLMFTSRAYRQSSQSSAAMNERDPDNRLLARGPRFRPTGEQLRDQALCVSGLLNDKLFGPPVRPVRPNLGLTTAFGGSNDWTPSTGEDRHRRSIYTETKRNSPYPSFTTFDAPNREVCTIRRGRSNTPLQAFVTLNDPVFVETHQAMARRILADGGKDDAARLRLVFQLCLARDPDAAEAKTLTNLLTTAKENFRADTAAATKAATDPLGPAAKDADLPTLAAWTVVAGVVMNLDEFLMRR